MQQTSQCSIAEDRNTVRQLLTAAPNSQLLLNFFTLRCTLRWIWNLQLEKFSSQTTKINGRNQIIALSMA